MNADNAKAIAANLLLEVSVVRRPDLSSDRDFKKLQDEIKRFIEETGGMDLRKNSILYKKLTTGLQRNTEKLKEIDMLANQIAQGQHTAASLLKIVGLFALFA